MRSLGGGREERDKTTAEETEGDLSGEHAHAPYVPAQRSQPPPAYAFFPPLANVRRERARARGELLRERTTRAAGLGVPCARIFMAVFTRRGDSAPRQCVGIPEGVHRDAPWAVIRRQKTMLASVRELVCVFIYVQRV